MRLLIICGLSLSLLLSACFFGSTLNFTEADAVGKPNLVPNGGFEHGIYGIYKRDTLPEHWMVLQTPRQPDASAWEEGNGYNSARYIRLNAGRTRLSLISDSFDLIPQAGYYNHVWLKTDLDNGEEVECRFIAFDVEGNTVNQFTQRVVPSAKWTRVEFNAAFFKKTARYGRIMVVVQPQPERRIWIDNIGSYNVLSYSD
ncbi:MAG: hypothetical protein K8R90_00955 [Candidatus Cloacimonetes bacterium]|nr:hypothetical protein [Candidatus Cloacimonadota bacterium]